MIHNDVLDRYDSFLAKKTKKVECRSAPGYTYPHLRWMIEEIRSGRVHGEKSHRWLGFIQGVLIREDHFKVNEEREFTRPYLHDDAGETKAQMLVNYIQRLTEGDDVMYDMYEFLHAQGYVDEEGFFY